MTQEETSQTVEISANESIHVPEEIPIMPLREMVIFPRMILPMIVGDERLVKLVDDTVVKDRFMGLVAIHEAAGEEVSPEQLFGVGMLTIIQKMLKMPDGSLRLLIQGVSRIRLREFVQKDPYLRARIEVLEDEVVDDMEVRALAGNIKGLFKRLLELSPHLPSELGIIALNVESPGNLADLVAANLNVKMEEKQEILETLNVRKRLEKVLELLNRETQILELGSKIQSEMKGQMDKTQRDYYLREQLKAIQRELGETDDRGAEIQELREKIAKANYAGGSQGHSGSRVGPPFQDVPGSGRVYGLQDLFGLAHRVAVVGVDGGQSGRLKGATDSGRRPLRSG